MILHRFQITKLLLAAFTIAISCADVNVDLQWAICDRDAATVLRKLGHARKQPYKSNLITYYDTWPPIYTVRGLAFRTKVRKHQPISLIKARFDEETENVPAEADCVWDQYGDSTYYTCGLPSLLQGNEQIIWSEEQVLFAARYQEVDWDGLVPYGPFINPKWKLEVLGHKAVLDDVLASVGTELLHLMEIEVRAEKDQSERAYKEITQYLQERDVVLCEPVQLPKTLRLFDAMEKVSRRVQDHDQVALQG